MALLLGEASLRVIWVGMMWEIKWILKILWIILREIRVIISREVLSSLDRLNNLKVNRVKIQSLRLLASFLRKVKVEKGKNDWKNMKYF